MALRLGLVVNPVAGIGGPAALKGSDGLAAEAAEHGYDPVAPQKALRFLRRLHARGAGTDIRVFAASGALGAATARAAGWKVGLLGPEKMLDDPFTTDAVDTQDAAREALAAEMDLLVFVGGDGTARDVARAIGTRLPALGVPAGVKMFSECFAETPEAAADLVIDLARGHAEGSELSVQAADVLDLDEDAYRAGEMRVLHHDTLHVPRSPRVQAAKCPACPPEGLDGAVAEVLYRMNQRPEAYYIIGSGSTTQALKTALGIDGTLIGVDVATGERDDQGVRWTLVARDADAHRLEALAVQARTEGRPILLVLSPIGGQGFVLGRGTAQITPQTVRAAVPDGVWVLATAGKLQTLASGALRVDTGDPLLDAEFPRYLRVITGMARERMLRVERSAA